MRVRAIGPLPGRIGIFARLIQSDNFRQLHPQIGLVFDAELGFRQIGTGAEIGGGIG